MANEIENVYTSLLEYLQGELTETTLKYPGVDLKTEALTEWAEIYVTGPIGASVRSGEREEAYEVTINCFARTGFDDGGNQQENAYRHLEIADAVRVALNQYDLAVEDFVGGSLVTIAETSYDIGDNYATDSGLATGLGFGQAFLGNGRWLRGVKLRLGRVGSPPASTGSVYI